jgi:uncharacterized protein
MKQEDSEQQYSDEQPDERPSLPLGPSLSCGLGTFLVAGGIDMVAHFGLTGLVVGGIAAYAASQHGPELLEHLKGAWPATSARPSVYAQAKAPRTLASESRGGSKRSILDRALGRFPGDEATSGEEIDTVLVEEAETASRVSSRAFRPSVLAHVVRHPICLAPNLVVEANDIVGAGINIFGVKGSGKTGAVARLAEQFARYRVSQVCFDLKGDLTSLVTDRRQDGRPYVPNGFVGSRGRAPRGRAVLHRGAQVVYDLRSWQTPEQMAGTICAIVEEMLETVALTPEGELAPCLVFLDEAEYWLPQAQPSYLSGHTYKRLLDAFHLLATMGRSRGLAPVIATQRIAKVNKDIIAQAEMNLFMKAVLDIDLDRYYDYFAKALASRERIRGFAAGEAILCLPDGSQTVTRLLERESRHLSHTPHVTAALTRFAGMREQREPLSLELQDDGAARDAMEAEAPVPSADQSIRRVTAPPPYANMEYTMPPLTAIKPARARLSPELERALGAWNEGATTARGLADALKAQGIQCEKDKAASLLRRLRELGEIS